MGGRVDDGPMFARRVSGASAADTSRCLPDRNALPDMGTAKFLARVVPPGNYIAISYQRPATDRDVQYGKGKVKRGDLIWRNEFFAGTDTQGAAKFISRCTHQDKWNVYHAMASFTFAEPMGKTWPHNNQPRYKGVREASKAQLLRTLWIDLDIKRDGDKKRAEDCFPTLKAALAWTGQFRQATGIPAPNLMVRSGYGVHLYWVLEEPVAYAEWVPYAEALRAAMLANGFIGDSGVTTDGARVLRPVGAMNFKVPSDPKPVYLMTEGADLANEMVLAPLRAWLGKSENKAAIKAGATALAGGAPGFTLTPMPESTRRLFGDRHLPDMNAAANANLLRQRCFEDLTSEEMVRCMLALVCSGLLDSIADASREQWLRVLFGFAHVAHLAHDTAEREQAGSGLAVADMIRKLALVWSKRSARFVSEADFDRDWRSFDLHGGITVGTLIKAGRNAGFDFGPWFGADEAVTTGVAPASSTLTTTVVAPFFNPIPTDSCDLYAVPWLMLGFLLRGDITLLAAPGGGAKTAVAVSIAVALAAGRLTWGSFGIKPRLDRRPTRVAYVGTEEDLNRLGLLIQAAMTALNLSPAERAAVAANLVVHDARESGWKINPDRPEKLAELERALLAGCFDLVVLDTAAGLTELKDENDNLAITRVMSVLGKVARATNCAVLMICHTPKMSKRDIVAQRGDPSLVRGGGAWVNSARVAITLTGLPEGEAVLFAVNGIDQASVRCLLGAKINDRAQSSAPIYLRIRGVMVQVRDGSFQEVRAVEFISLPAPASASQPSAVLKVAMDAIKAGVMVAGTRQALSPRDGANTARGAQTHVADALRAHDGSLGHDQARALAKQALGTLISNGWVKQQEVPVPAQSSGKGNGTKMRQGLVCHWEESPWPNGGAIAATAAEHEQQATEAPSTQTTQNSLGGL